MTSYRISTLYFYEALLLVFSASLLGLMIGAIVGFTMVLQQDLFLKLKYTFYFPWTQTLEILALSVLQALIVTYGSASTLLRKSITTIFRMT